MAAPSGESIERAHAGSAAPREGLRLDELADGSLDEGLGARGNAEFATGAVEMEFDRAPAQRKDFADFIEGLAACRPGQRFALALSEIDACWPDRGARHPLQPCGNHRREQLEVHRLGNVVVGSPLPTLELIFAIGTR